MTPLIGTPLYNGYWKKRSVQLTNQLTDETLTDAIRAQIEYDLDIIDQDRRQVLGSLADATSDTCSTCDNGICTNGCMP